MKQRGLTLLEILVTIGLLTILLTLAAGIFSRFVLSERRETSERALQEDMRFALELFIREARTAYGSTFALSTNGGQVPLGEMVVFRNQLGQCVAYRRFADTENNLETLERAEQPSSDECDTILYSNFQPITSKRTHLTKLDFIIPEAITVNNALVRQGFITIILNAESTITTLPPLQMQTTVTSRQVKPFAPTP